MKDIDGKDLKIGDKVACTTSKYEQLSIGHIIEFTEYKIRILLDKSKWKVLKFPHQVAIIN